VHAHVRPSTLRIVAGGTALQAADGVLLGQVTGRTEHEFACCSVLLTEPAPAGLLRALSGNVKEILWALWRYQPTWEQ
jgi:hypothetical protein